MNQLNKRSISTEGGASGGDLAAAAAAVAHNSNQHLHSFPHQPSNVVSVMAATPESGSDRTVNLQYTDTKVIGNGSFGVVYLAKLLPSGEDVAIKRVLQDKRFKVGSDRVVQV